MTDVSPGALVRLLDLPTLVTAILTVMMEIAHTHRSTAKSRKHSYVALGEKGGAAMSTEARLDACAGSSTVFYGMHLLVGCVLSRADCLPALVRFPYFTQWLKYFTLQAPAPCRFSVAQGIARICRCLPLTVSDRGAATDSGSPITVSASLVPP
jgi:hypothetical protein